MGSLTAVRLLVWVSVAVRSCVPDVSKVTRKVPVPLVRALLAGQQGGGGVAGGEGDGAGVAGGGVVELVLGRDGEW